jgi:hypothetical protein
MIGQYLPNNNEKSYSAVLQKKFASKPVLGQATVSPPLSFLLPLHACMVRCIMHGHNSVPEPLNPKHPPARKSKPYTPRERSGVMTNHACINFVATYSLTFGDQWYINWYGKINYRYYISR